MKSLKAKLMTSVVMLLVAAIALSTASYAWFTISTNPEVKDLKATVSTNENLEIAYARDLKTLPNNYGSSSTNAQDWGNLVDTTYTDNDKYAVDYNLLDKTLRPVFLGDGSEKLYTLDEEVDPDGDDFNAAETYILANGKIYPKTPVEITSVAGTFYYPVYEYTLVTKFGDDENQVKKTYSDGRICYYEELVEVPCQIDNPKFDDKKAESKDNPKYIDVGVGYIMQQTGSTNPTARLNAGGDAFTVTGGVVYGYYVDYWVRSNIDGILRLSKAANRSGQDLDGDTTNADDGEGSWFKTNELTKVDKPTDPGADAEQADKDKYNAAVLAYEAYIENQRKAVQLASAIRIALKDVTVEVEDTDPLDSTAKYAVTDPVVVADADATPAVVGDTYSVAKKIGRETEQVDDPNSTTTPKAKIWQEKGIVRETISKTSGTTTTVTVDYKANFNEKQNLVELEANLAKTLRFYVYLNGGSVTNEAATTDTFTNAGTLNLQFRLVGTDATDGEVATEVIDQPMPIVDEVESAES